MPVFNIAANQRLASPIRSYYQGKAVRLGIENQRLANEALEKDIEMADAKFDLEERRVEAQEKAVELREQELANKVEEYGRLVGKDKALEEANTIIGITEGAQASDDPIAYANKRMPEFIKTLPRGEGRTKLEEMAEDGFQPEEMKELYAFALATNKQFSSGSVSPTGKMVEGLSMGLRPGTPEWEEWIKGSGKDGKPLAAEVKADMVYELLNNNTFKGERVDEETKRALLESLDVEVGAKGSVTIKPDDAEEMAESIMDRTGIKESDFWQINEEEFEERLTYSLIRLFKDGRFGGKELEERALADAIGVNWPDVLALLEEKNERQPEDKQFAIMDILKHLAAKE
jgi:hypothetical protein